MLEERPFKQSIEFESYLIMSSFYIKNWNRVEDKGTVLYLNSLNGGWFSPNKTADKLLISLKEDPSVKMSANEKSFLDRLPAEGVSEEYKPGSEKGRGLKELWFHVTNKCNLSCNHCLFSSSPQESIELPFNEIEEISKQAYEMGCRIFALTGGEPFVHKEYSSVIEHLLAFGDTHVVVLSNGLLLNQRADIKKWGKERFHLQISVDGLQEDHERIRGEGSWEKLLKNLDWLKENNFPYTISMSIDNRNALVMEKIIDFAHDHGASNVHFMWYFVKGRGENSNKAEIDQIYKNLLKAMNRAEEVGIALDNIESLKTQLFAPYGTAYDGCTSGIEACAVGPDKKLYPSASLVGEEMLGIEVNGSLKKSWQKSDIFKKIRSESIANINDPFKFILGGGDLEHSFVNNKTFIGDDPYSKLHEKLIIELVRRNSKKCCESPLPQINLKMGDLLETCGNSDGTALVHTNCLLAISGNNVFSNVKSFYKEAAENVNEDILNPISYSDEVVEHIPEDLRFRGYGCGSPVDECEVEEGEHLLDLGCGAGVECFIASKKAGKTGKVTGVDVLEPMLKKAQHGAVKVSEILGYNNLDFKQGLLEELPIGDNTVDVVISNCVMNLSTNKRKAYLEILRTLKPGGRLVISDVVTEVEPGADIRNSKVLSGECIGGAMTQNDLVGILRETGFTSIEFIKRFPYRNVEGHNFYSLTYRAYKPSKSERVKVIYKGPFSLIELANGKILTQGTAAFIDKTEAELYSDNLFIINEFGSVENSDGQSSCCCN